MSTDTLNTVKQTHVSDTQQLSLGITMLVLVLVLFLSLSKAAGVTVVTQKQFSTVKEGETALLTCTQEGSDQYMYWYRQYPRKGLELILYSRRENMDLEKEFTDDRFSATRPNRQSFPLTITELQTNDSAVYYCASSTQYVRVM
ncbi:hypothetical protein HHUSO_G21631 [Huso huso]|uniref:Ig-like domain-containing protein n=1 Tax=Huso huso TaxID=61971 RepID=A0ABR0YZE2_HUSHU